MGVIFENGFYLGGSPNPVSPTPTPTVSVTPTPSSSEGTPSTPTPTASVTPTVTPTQSSMAASPTPTPTPTLTPSSTSTPTGFITINEVGSNVVMTASGTLDISSLTLVTSNNGPNGGGGLGINSATFLMGANGTYFDEYSGFTSTPSNFGSGGGLGSTSGSGDAMGVIMQGAPPYHLIVPAGYTSGTQITSSATFTGQTFSSLGLTQGTYTYTWGSDSINVVVGGPAPTPTPSPSVGSNVGTGSWYFYSDEGTINAGPPTANGNAIFTIQGSPIIETFNPNENSGTSYLYFDVKDSVGTDYTTQFSGLTTGGTISVIQNGDVATYTGGSGAFTVTGGGGGNQFFMIITSVATQVVTSSAPFVYADPISIRFGS